MVDADGFMPPLPWAEGDQGPSHDRWGPYRGSVVDGVVACADYLGRLERSLAGEIAPDRHYFGEKAVRLQEVTRRLARLTQDVETWLGACGAAVDRTDGGASCSSTCELPAGHHGEHDDDPPPTPTERARDDARDLSDRGEELARRVHRFGLEADRRDAAGQAPDDENPKALRELQAMSAELRERASHVTARVDALAEHHRLAMVGRRGVRSAAQASQVRRLGL